MSIAKLISDIDDIVRSDPAAISDIARAWQEAANVVAGKLSDAKRDLQKLSVAWDSQRFVVLGYRANVELGLTALHDGAEQVAKGLSDAAPRLATIKNNLMLALAGIAVGAGGLVAGLVGLVGAVGFLGVGGAAHLVALTNLVNAYQSELAFVRNALVAAQGKFDELQTLYASGGVVPASPDLPTAAT